MKPVEQPSSPGERCTRYVALHPLRGATPDVGRYTRSEEVQCLRIGCSATPHKYHRGHAIQVISREHSSCLRSDTPAAADTIVTR